MLAINDDDWDKSSMSRSRKMGKRAERECVNKILQTIAISLRRSQDPKKRETYLKII